MTNEGMVNVDFDVGVRLSLGDVLAEVAENDMPCKILDQLPYIDGKQCAEFIKTLVGRRGWYAKVVEEFGVSVGDQVGVEWGLDQEICSDVGGDQLSTRGRSTDGHAKKGSNIDASTNSRRTQNGFQYSYRPNLSGSLKLRAMRSS